MTGSRERRRAVENRGQICRAFRLPTRRLRLFQGGEIGFRIGIYQGGWITKPPERCMECREEDPRIIRLSCTQ